MRWPTALWLAARGQRSDLVRVTLTAAGAALGTLAVLAAATVLAIGPQDGPYTSNLLSEGGLRPGVAIALLLLCIPTLAFVGQCVRIGAPARDRRLAAIRLAGGTPADSARVACGEAAAAAGLGALVGLALFLGGRLLLDDPTPGTFFVERSETLGDGSVNVTSVEVAGLIRPLPTDVLPPWWVVVLLVAAIPLAAALGTGLALRRVTISPFGVVRRRPSRPPRICPACCSSSVSSGWRGSPVCSDGWIWMSSRLGGLR